MAGNDQPGSDRGELKRLLKMAADRPINMAFALGADGKAVLKLDKMKPARSLEKGLKEGVDGAKLHRFGTVTIDPEDGKTVTFVVNKAGGGIARKLVQALKGTGFKTVRLTTEDGAELESHEEEDEEADAAAQGEGNGVSAAAPDGPAGAAAAAAAPQAPAAPDPSDLTRQLTGLVKQMMAVIAKDPTQKTALAEFAIDAQASLKRGDLDQAAAGIDMLRQAIEAGGGASAAPGPAARRCAHTGCPRTGALRTRISRPHGSGVAGNRPSAQHAAQGAGGMDRRAGKGR